MNLLEKNNLKKSKSTSLRVEQSILEEVSLRMRRELFYVKEDDYLLYGNRFQRGLAVFSEFRLTPPSGWVGKFLTTFGSHWDCHCAGRYDLYNGNECICILG